MLPDSRHDSFGFERDDAEDSVPVRRSQIVVRDARLMGQERAGDDPERVVTATQAATSRDEEIARRAFCAGFPVPRWCASVRLTMSSNRSRARVALCAVSRVASGRLGLSSIGCDPDQPFR